MSARPQVFIIVREQPGCTSHATIRASYKPWKALASCTNTSGPKHAAETVARKAGYPNHTVEKVPDCLWNEVAGDYLTARRCHAIVSIYRLS